MFKSLKATFEQIKAGSSLTWLFHLKGTTDGTVIDDAGAQKRW